MHLSPGLRKLIISAVQLIFCNRKLLDSALDNADVYVRDTVHSLCVCTVLWGLKRAAHCLIFGGSLADIVRSTNLLTFLKLTNK